MGGWVLVRRLVGCMFTVTPTMRLFAVLAGILGAGRELVIRLWWRRGRALRPRVRQPCTRVRSAPVANVGDDYDRRRREQVRIDIASCRLESLPEMDVLGVKVLQKDVESQEHIGQPGGASTVTEKLAREMSDQKGMDPTRRRLGVRVPPLTRKALKEIDDRCHVGA